MVSIVIPAHNEEQLVGRLLTSLTSEDLEAEILVVANGCTDATAVRARTVPGVTVLETPVPSKSDALALGDRHATRFPRLYVDADVLLRPADVRDLAAALSSPGRHATGPQRVLAMRGVSRFVRAYYAIWRQLPGVRAELYGRGVVAVDRTGHQRLAHWPRMMSDDLLIAMSFAPHEIAVVPTARVIIRPPRHYRDLLRRRIRVATGNGQLGRAPQAPPVRGSGAGLVELARLVRGAPALLPAAGVFVLTVLVARTAGHWAAVRGSTVWLRDESSRSG